MNPIVKKVILLNKFINLTNLVTNGDFSGGTTGWTGNFGVASVSQNTYALTGNGANAEPYSSQLHAMIAANKYYFKFRVRVTNPNCANIKVRPAAGYGDINIANPVENQWYAQSAVVTPSTSGNLEMYFKQVYSDAATANGKVMELQYLSLINLSSAFGFGNEPTAAQMDFWYPNWFNGIKKVIVK